MKRKDSPWWSAGFTREWWFALEREDRETFLDALTDDELESFFFDWRVWARDKQLVPEGIWTTWMLLAGRGFGKTRTGGEALREFVYPVGGDTGVGRIALLGQGEDDIREVMIEGESGVMAISPKDERPTFRPSVGAGRLIWPNGAMAYVYSAMDPEALRGPQFELGWADEPMAFPPENRKKAISNLKMGLRLGTRPRLIYSTTPKPHRWLREETAKANKAAIDKVTGAILPMARRRYIITKGSTHENAENLPPSFLEGITEDYEGTNLGRQEIYAEILGDEEGALWTPELLDRCRMEAPSHGTERLAFLQEFAKTCDKVVIGVDPNVSAASKTIHAAGIVVCGRRGKHRFVLEDRSTKGGPTKWVAAALKAYDDFDADEIVPEVNQGGDLVRMAINSAAERDVVVRPVKASKGKQRRAEPVAMAYERGEVFHLGDVGTTDKPGPMFMIESQMCALHEALDPTGEDFDRCDGAVWGLTRLGAKRASGSPHASGVGIRTVEELIGSRAQDF